VKVRRAHSLVFFWNDNELTAANYLTSDQVVCDPFLLQVLNKAPEFISIPLLAKSFGFIPKIKKLINGLVARNLLLKEGSREEKTDASLFENWKWGHDARFFHFATKEVSYNFNFEEIRKFFEARSLTDPPPSPFKTDTSAPKIRLSRVADKPADFWETLYDRRTCREFSTRAISKKDLSSFLVPVVGMTRYYNESVLDRRIIKTSPSGGARHPVELYIIIQNVRSVPRGIYHYQVETNSLCLVNKAVERSLVIRLFSGQDWVGDAPVSFIFTGVLNRSMWKYDHSRAYKVLLLDTGHLGQTFHLVGTALGFGVFTTAAIQDKLIEKYLKIDGITEIVLYGGCIGHKAIQALG
jgi:SagB-type dehydrogenase family enzyme